MSGEENAGSDDFNLGMADALDHPDRGDLDDGLDVVEKEIVRASNGEVQGIEVPAGFQPALWRRGLTVVNQHWDRHGKVPTVDEAYALWPKIPKSTYSVMFAEPEFVRALALRGIDLDMGASLSDIQHIVIMKLTDPSDRRSEKAKLQQLGVSWGRYQGWLKNPIFMQEKRRKAEETFADVVDVATIALRGNVEDRDQRAIEFALAMSGRYNPQQQAIADARTVILLVIESVIRHVSDPKTREQIMTDVKVAAAGFDLANQRELEN